METKKIWSLAIVFAVSLTRIGSGLFSSLSGPTLLYLTENVDSTVSSVSYVFTGRAAGSLVGSVACGFLIRYYKNYKPLLTVGVGIVISGVLMLLTPWIHSLVGLVVATSFTGLLFGYLDAGSQSLYLQLWGEKESRPYLQSFHFAFGIGAVLAPVIAAPFLELADQQSDTDNSCPKSSEKSNYYNNKSAIAIAATTAAGASEEGFNPVGWTYVMSGAFTILTGAFMVALALLGAENKVKNSDEDNDDGKRTEDENDVIPEEPISDVVWLFLPIVCYYFIIVSLELLYQSFIYSIALCSDLAFSISDSAWLNTLFWIGFMVGRGSGIFVSSVFQPRQMILYDLVGTTLAMIVMTAFGETVPLIVWFVSFFHGFSVAWFYSSGISWTSQKTNVSSTYIFIFGLGNTIGSMAMPAVAGELFDMEPYNVVYLLLSLTIVNIFVTFWMFHMGNRHESKSSNNYGDKSNSISVPNSTRL